MPDSFTELTALVQLYISNNQLSTLPENFGNLDNLYILDLGYNQINQLPNSIVDLDGLGYLWLFNNQLTELPENFCALELDWSGDDYFGYPYFAIGGNMLCENLPECVENSDHLNTSLEQYYYSVQITVEQDCDWLDLSNQNIEFGINNIYPNPFNPVVSIDLSIDIVGHLQLSVFTIEGIQIKTIYNGPSVAGKSTFVWRPENRASGFYFISAVIDNQMRTQKVLLLK